MPRFLAARPNSELITLPWGTPLADWPEENLVALPRGISRHVVRFVRVAKEIYAFKEVIEHLALHEYRAAAGPCQIGHSLSRGGGCGHSSC